MRYALSILIALVVSGVVAPGTALAAGEIFVLGSYLSGEVDDGVSRSEQALTLRYVHGQDLQFRVDMSMLRVEGYPTTLRTGVGPVPHGSGNSHSGNGSSVGGGPTAGAVLPQNGGGPPVETTQGWTTGLGDLRLGLGKRIFGGGVKLFRTDAVAAVKVPVADEETGLGTGEWDAQLGFTGEYRFWSATAYGGLTWNRLGDPAWIELNDALDAFAGADSEPLAGERLILSGWVEGHQEVVDGTGGRAAVGLSLRSIRGVRWRASVAADVLGEYRQVHVLLGISYGVTSAGPGVRGVER